MVKIAICDDEEYYVQKIKKLVENILQQKGMTDYRIDTYESGQELCKDAEKIKEYGIVFLDINMQGMNGIEAAEWIRDVNSEVYLVFVTAYVDYAVEGYRVEAIRFLLKDMLDKMLSECMNTILEKMKNNKRIVSFPFVEGRREVLLQNIYCIENQKHKQTFHLYGKKDTEFHLYSKLDDLEQELSCYGFIRIHKSYLVNVRYIAAIENYKVKLKTGEALPVPREKYREVKARYFEMMGDI